MHHDLHPYPNNLPPSILTMVVDALRGNAPDPKCASHAVWHCVGYGLGKWDDCNPLIGDAKPYTEAEAASALENSFGSGDEANIPWPLIIPILIALIERLWPRRRA